MSGTPGLIRSEIIDSPVAIPGVELAHVLYLELWDESLEMTIVAEDPALLDVAPMALLAARVLGSQGDEYARAVSVRSGGEHPYRLHVKFELTGNAKADDPLQLVVGDSVSSLR